MKQHFGAALRAHRQARGISLAALSKAVNYSKGHLSNIERGARIATKELARTCDDALDAGGRLSGLVLCVANGGAANRASATEADVLGQAIEALGKIAALANELGAGVRLITDAVVSTTPRIGAHPSLVIADESQTPTSTAAGSVGVDVPAPRRLPAGSDTSRRSQSQSLRKS